MKEQALSAEVFLSNLHEHEQVLADMAALAPQVSDVARRLAQCLASGGKVLFCGNGGSAADAQHLAAEFTGRYGYDRRPLAAVALHCDTSALTAIGNDYGFDHIYMRQVQALGRPGDMLVGISTSGNSANVLLAMEAARAAGLTCVALTGQGGGRMAALADVLLAVPASRTPRIQEMHILLGHTLCGMVEQALCEPPHGESSGTKARA
ncbi:MAG TPA: D-sedoheptulose 7-phosphate isomerase [Candidatus Avidesulfovibrio excrementigallinarum]|nr:D-sedoheptulose 7-phosphate isomerase [Candidatus Avidesulfovibrio excrementigallinarum]